MNTDKLHTPDTVSGDFPVNVCVECGRGWECYRTYTNWVCEECEEASAPPADGETASDRDQK